MYTKKLTKWQEWFESDRIVGTSFLHGWNEKEAEEKAIDCLEADKYAFCDGTIDMIETERIDTNE